MQSRKSAAFLAHPIFLTTLLSFGLAACGEPLTTSPVAARAAADGAGDADSEGAPGSVQFDSAAYLGAEGSAVAVTVVRVGGHDGKIRVRYATVPGSAEADADFVPAAGELEWKSGDAGPRTFTVTLADDTTPEADESLQLVLSEAHRATLGVPSAATLSIADNDAAPTAASYQQLTFEDHMEHTEPDVRVNPADPNHVLVSWMQRPKEGDLNDCAIATTFDGGVSWSKHVFLKYGHAACADISMAFAPFATPERANQTVYVASIGYGAPGGIGGLDGASTYNPRKGLTGQIYLFRSDDGGVTWSAPTIAYDWADPRAPAAFDRPWIAVDHSHSRFRGRVYVSDMTVFAQTATPRIYLKYSDDGGASFSPPIEVDRINGDTGRSTPFATLATGADGRVMLVYRAWATGVADDQPDTDGNTADILHAAGVPQNQNGVLHPGERSGEGYCVACFSTAAIEFKPESIGVDPNADFALMLPEQRPYRIQWNMLPFTVSGAPRNSEESPTYAAVAGDPTRPGRFAAVFVESRYAKEATASDFNHVPPGHRAAPDPQLDLDISFTWTDDAGAHWSRPVRVNDDVIGDGVIQDRAWLTFDPGSGLPVVAWRDRRDSLVPQRAGNGVMTDLYAARLLAFGARDWGDALQHVSQAGSANLRRYDDAPRFGANARLSSPLAGWHGGGFTPRSSLSDSFFSISVAGPTSAGAGRIWAVWAPILATQGNGTVPDDVADLEGGRRQIMLRIWDPSQPLDLSPYGAPAP